MKVRGSGMGLIGNVLRWSNDEFGRHDAKAGGNARQHLIRLEGAGHEEDDDVAEDDGAASRIESG